MQKNALKSVGVIVQRPNSTQRMSHLREPFSLLTVYHGDKTRA